MAIYQVHMRDQHGLILDEDGVELLDALAAAHERGRSQTRRPSKPTSWTGSGSGHTPDEAGRDLTWSEFASVIAAAALVLVTAFGIAFSSAAMAGADRSDAAPLSSVSSQ